MNFAPLADVAEIFMGQSPPGSTYNTDGNGLPFFQGKTDFGDIYPTVRMFCTEPKRIAELNDILISVRAPVGPTNLAPIKSAIGRGLAAIRCKEGTDVKYLLYFLRHNESKLARLGTGSTFEAIGRDDLEDVSVPLLSLPEQRRIAALLDRAGHLRRTRRYAAQLSDTFLQSVFVRMFGEDSYSDAVELEDIITLGPSNGLYKSEEFIGTGTLFLDIKGLYRGFVADLSTARRIQTTDQELERYGLRDGDILINRVSKKPEGVGKTVLVQGLDEPTVYESNMMRFRIDPERLDAWFLIYHLASNSSRRELFSKANISNQASINQEMVKSLRLMLPPLALQQKFARIVQQFERLRAQQREAERQAEHLFHTLLHRAFSGEL